MDVGVAVVPVGGEAVVAVLREEPDLVRPGADLLVVLAAGRRRPPEVSQEALHALHLLPDELHVAPDTAQQQRLVADEAQQRCHGAGCELRQCYPAGGPCSPTFSLVYLASLGSSGRG